MTSRPGEVGSHAPEGFRADLQGLRAVAVLLVAVNHLGTGFLGGGYVGVDVFFVLSGFLITGLLLHEARRRGSISIPGFYLRRARRILPAAALTLVVTDLAAYYLLNFVRARDVMWDSIAAAFFGANIRFAQSGTDYFALSQPPSPIQHYWSLAVEEQFYLVWPAVLALVLFAPSVARRLAGRRWRPYRIRGRQMVLLFAVVAFTGAASLAWSVVQTRAHPASAYFSTVTRAWELALGAAVAIAATMLGRIPAAVRSICGWGGLAAIGIAAVRFTSSTAFPGSAALLPTFGAALLILAGIGSTGVRWAPGRLLSLAPFRYVGDRSYAFYLWHWPVLIIAAEYEGHALSLFARSLLLVMAFMLSIISYRFVEDPIRRSDWSPAPTALLWPVSIGAVMLVAAFSLRGIDAKSLRLEEAAAAVVTPTEARAAAALPTRPKSATAGPAAAPRIVTVPTLAVVAAAAGAARHGAAIPAELAPSPSQLLSDHYGYPPGCGADDGQTSSKICRLGDAAAPKTIVVFGDSHVEMWMPALLALAQRDHFSVVPLIKQGCTPPRWVAAWGKPECQLWYPWAVAQLHRLKPAVTLISGAFDAGLGEPYSDTLAALSKAASSAERVSKTIVIEDPPSQTKQPLDCLLGHGADMRRCSSTPSDEQLNIRSGVSDAVTRAGATFLDTTGWFCYQNLCPMVVAHRVVFLDVSHITQTYALSLTPLLGLELRRAERMRS